MRHIFSNKKGVSNVLGYLFSFTIATMVMISALLITTSIIDDRTAKVGNMQAQSIANKVADAIVEAVTVGQSMSEQEYKKILDLPEKIAGRNYYVEVTDTFVYVNTTDGLVKKSCPTYGAESSKIGVSSGKVYGGKLNITLTKSDALYKFDFGTGTSTSHSPVESGYYMVTNLSSTEPAECNPPWWSADYKARVPILIENDSPENLKDMPIKVVLSSDNFDYSLANVNVDSTSQVTSDLTFIDPSNQIVATINIATKQWNPSWFYTYYDPTPTTGTIEVQITDISGGYDLSYIDGATIRLKATREISGTWNPVTHKAIFNRREALKILTNKDENHFLEPSYTVTLRGQLKNGLEFSGTDTITIANAIYVNPSDDLPTKVSNAASGSTIFVRKGEYKLSSTSGGYAIVINKRLNIIGENRDYTIITNKYAPPNIPTFIHVSSTNYVSIDSFKITGGSCHGDGIEVATSQYVNITNCKIESCKNGIYVKGTYHATPVDSKYISIFNCETSYNVGDPGYGDGINVMDSAYIRIAGCKSHHQNNERGDGIDVTGCQYVLITNCKSYQNTGQRANGILIEDSHDCKILNSNIYGNNGLYSDGIVINVAEYSDDFCYNNLIENCTIYGNDNTAGLGSGVFIRGNGPLLTPIGNNTIRNCKIFENTIGVNMVGYNLASGFRVSQCNNVDHCEIHDNEQQGVYLWTTVGLGTCRYNNITYCNIYNNGLTDSGYAGISMDSADYNRVEHCNIFDNGNDGLQLRGAFLGVIAWFATYNTIQYNNFYCNGKITPSGCGVWCAGNGILGASYNEIHYNNFAYDTAYDPDINGPIFNNYHYAMDDTSPDIYGDLRNNWDWNFWDNRATYGAQCPSGNCIYSIPSLYDFCLGSQDNHPRGPDWIEDYDEIPDVIIVDGSYNGATNHHNGGHYHPKSIAEGIANVQPEGTVKIMKNGSSAYKEHGITIDKELTIVGVGGPKINGEGNDAIIVDAHHVNISGLIINNSNSGVKLNTGKYYSIIKDCSLKQNSKGIYLDSNYYTTIQDCTVSSNGDGIYIHSGNDNEIKNCMIYSNTQNGIWIDGFSGGAFGHKSDIINCRISSNFNGIFLNGDSSVKNANTIENCLIYSNTNYGILFGNMVSNNYIDSSKIYSNSKTGIYLDSTERTSVNNSDIYSNTQYGIYITGSASNNEIKNCKIYENAKSYADGYGIYISSSLSNNKIYNNKFTDNGDEAHDNAYDNGVNQWDNGPITTTDGGGNLWDDYDEPSENAIDANGDGVADLPYDILGGSSEDNYPFCKRPIEMPYYVDYWNPYGESVILLNVSLANYTYKYIYLYYGGTNANTHSIGDVSVFFDDFDTSLDANKWALLSPAGRIYASGGNLVINASGYDPGYIPDFDGIYALTSNYKIPAIVQPIEAPYSQTINQSMYIVEARMNTNNSEGNMIMCHDDLFPEHIYWISVNAKLDKKTFALKKNIPTGMNMDGVKKISDLNHWIRLKSIYYFSWEKYNTGPGPANQSINMNLTSTIYDFDSYADEAIVSGSEHNVRVGGTWSGSNPYNGGRIGLGCAFSGTSPLNKVLVDWIRVMKTPVIPPTVSIGPAESANYGWDNPNEIHSKNIITTDPQAFVNPFNPGPVLRDFNYGTTTASGGNGRFTIKNIPKGMYSITITMGSTSEPCDSTRAEFRDDLGNYYGSLSIPPTGTGKFETKWLPINFNWDGSDETRDLEITFSAEINKVWRVNSMIIEPGRKGIYVGLE